MRVQSFQESLKKQENQSREVRNSSSGTAGPSALHSGRREEWSADAVACRWAPASPGAFHPEPLKEVRRCEKAL